MCLIQINYLFHDVRFRFNHVYFLCLNSKNFLGEVYNLGLILNVIFNIGINSLLDDFNWSFNNNLLNLELGSDLVKHSVSFDDLRNLYNVLDNFFYFDYLISDHLYWNLLPERYYHLSFLDFNLSYCKESIDNLLFYHMNFLLDNNLNWNLSLYGNFLNNLCLVGQVNDLLNIYCLDRHTFDWFLLHFGYNLLNLLFKIDGSLNL